MTTIVGVEGIDYAVLVADSQITEDNLITIATSTPKIIEVGKYLIGISGDTRPGDILAYNWKPPAYRGEDPAQFMGKKVIPSINTAFNDNNYDYNKVDKDGGFDYIIAFNGNIFRIACDLSFFQANHGAYAIGSGGQLALGYLYSISKPDMELAYAKRHARKAVEIAAVLDSNTNKPLQLVVQERM
jgi:20S proteasome alpha/beta subunit